MASSLSSGIIIDQYGMLQNCKYCKSQIYGIGSSYKCTDTHCKGYVHKACQQSKPNSSKFHPFITNLSLKFSDKKFNGKQCDACSSPVEGIMYTGSDENNTYFLHPHCLDLPKSFRNNSQLQLKLCGQIPEGINCMFCEGNDEKFWAYCVTDSGGRKFGCHIRCLKDHLVKHWYKNKIKDEQASLEKYFRDLYKKDVRKITKMVGGFGLAAAALGLDLIFSAFVGAPLSTLLSLVLEVSVEAAKKKLEAFEKNLHIN